MEIIKEYQTKSSAIKIIVKDNGRTIGRAYLYLIYNDLHQKPYGFMEDIFVAEEYRKKGIGKKLIEVLIEEAKKQGCYKLVGTSRHDRAEVHVWYERLGFKDYGKEFRMDF